MDDFAIAGADNLFVNSFDQQMRLESIANQALNAGIDHYLKKDYEKAIKEFEKSINLSPTSPYTPDATQYLAQTFLKLDKPDDAIEAYKRGIELNRDRDDLHAALGNLYYAEEKYDDAVNSYKEAVRLNPLASNHYALGQGYMKQDKLQEAEAEFRTVLRLEPESVHGNFGLGQAFSKMERYDDAIEQFESITLKQADYYDAYAEMGYAYADKGDMEAAEDLKEFLEDKDPDLSETLGLYINKVEPPKIMFVWGSSTFRSRMTMNTPLSALDSYLETAGATKSFDMKFQFNKEMDRASIENRFNWSMGRAYSGNIAKTYNFGNAIASTEVAPPTYPDYVLYDEKTRTATLGFRLTQNDTADGTIDPSHIVFKFDGKDAEGMKISEDHDEYTGFSGVA